MSREPQIIQRKILIISEDKNSFPDHLGLVLQKKFGFKNYSSSNTRRVRDDDYLYPEKIDSSKTQFLVNIYHFDTNPKAMVNHAISCLDEFEKIFCVFDKPDKRDQRNYSNYQEAIKIADKALEPKKIHIITSSPSYEFWLLMHFNKSTSVHSADEAISKLEELVRKNSQDTKKSSNNRTKWRYKKGKIQPEIGKIAIDKPVDAIANAKFVEKENEKNGSKEPFTKIYQLLEYLDEITGKKLSNQNQQNSQKRFDPKA